MFTIKTVKGDITKITDVQAIVNAANKSEKPLPIIGKFQILK